MNTRTLGLLATVFVLASGTTVSAGPPVDPNMALGHGLESWPPELRAAYEHAVQTSDPVCTDTNDTMVWVDTDGEVELHNVVAADELLYAVMTCNVPGWGGGCTVYMTVGHGNGLWTTNKWSWLQFGVVLGVEFNANNQQSTGVPTPNCKPPVGDQDDVVQIGGYVVSVGGTELVKIEMLG